MPRYAGFLPLYRGLFEHVRDGRISHTECFALIYMLTQADTRNGIWSGSASALAGELSIPARTARDILAKLATKGYLRTYAVPGKHSCYPIRIHKYHVTNGEHNGELVDALSSIGPRDYKWI
jgi:hypothetical protein